MLWVDASCLQYLVYYHMLHVSQYMYQDCSYNLVGDPIYAKKRDPVTRCKEINVETNEAMAIKSEV